MFCHINVLEIEAKKVLNLVRMADLGIFFSFLTIPFYIGFILQCGLISSFRKITPFLFTKLIHIQSNNSFFFLLSSWWRQTVPLAWYLSYSLSHKAMTSGNRAVVLVSALVPHFVIAITFSEFSADILCNCNNAMQKINVDIPG